MAHTQRTVDIGAGVQRSAFSVQRWAFSARWDALLLLVALVLCWLSLAPARELRLDVGRDGSELAYLSGVYQREHSEDRSYTYRWVSGDAALQFPLGQTGPLLLEARLHGAPTTDGKPLALRAALPDGQVLRFALPDQQRVYRIPLAAAAAPGGTLAIKLEGGTIVAPGDNRPLMLALDRLLVRPLAAPGSPAVPLIAGELLLLVGALACVGALGGTIRLRLLVGAALIVTLCWLNLTQRLWIGAAAWPLALGALLLCAVTLVIQPFVVRTLATPLLPTREGLFSTRYARLLWGIVLAGAALRLLGVLAPGFVAHDLDVQSEQFVATGNGLLYFTVHSHEWGKAATFYPPGPYLFWLPLMLVVPSAAIALHVGVALLDACGPLLLALLARQLGASQRAALLAAALLCMLPINLTALWWGFMTNSAGQVLLLLLALALLRWHTAPGARAAAFLFVAAVLLFLSHVGVLIQAGMLLALLALFDLGGAFGAQRTLAFTIQNPKSKIQNQKWFWLAAAAAVVALLYLSVVALPMLSEAQSVFARRQAFDPERLARDRAYIVGIMPRAIYRGTLGLPVLLTLPGLVLLWRVAPNRFARLLLLTWAITPLIFFAVDVAFILQVRYIFFAAPLCCLAAGTLLARLPGRASQIVAVAVVALVFASGSALWLEGAIIAEKPSLLPLTH